MRNFICSWGYIHPHISLTLLIYRDAFLTLKKAQKASNEQVRHPYVRFFMLSDHLRSPKPGMTTDAVVFIFFGGKTFQKRRVSSPAPVTRV